ncbi:MAG: hypothetical protein IJU81_04045 [Bacteroidales bacterium]|nr:hypothetical protein [Bacteroidales bacterium]
MTRLGYWLSSCTAYGLHSPYMFELYTRVLSARLGRDVRRRILPRGGCWGLSRRRYYGLLFKLASYFPVTEAVVHGGDAHAGMVLRAASSQVSVEECGEAGCVLLRCADGQRLLVVHAPHRSGLWCGSDGSLAAPSGYNVAVDLYDVALFIANSDLAPQRFTLRTGAL